MANFIPEIWSAALIANLRRDLVARSIATTQYEGEIRQQGDTVHIQRPVGLAATPYVPGVPVTYQVPASTTQALLIDQANESSFTVPDIAQVQGNVDRVAVFAAEASAALAESADAFVLGLAADAALDANEVELDLSDADPTAWDSVYRSMVMAGEMLDAGSVPRSGRFVVASPRLYAALQMDPTFLRATEIGDTVRLNGALGEIAGFQILRSANHPTRVVDGVVSDGSEDLVLFGHVNSIAYADQITNMEALRSPTSFADLVRMLHVFGSRILTPERLGRFAVKTVAEVD